MSTQDEVFKCICDELRYQAVVKEQMYQDSQTIYKGESERSVASWLLLIRGKYDDMVYNLSHEAGTVYTLGTLRELATLCIRCIMEHGGYHRQLNGTLVNHGMKPLDVDLAWDIAICERLYQERLGPERTDGRNHSISGFLVLLDCYQRKAFDAWTDNPGDDAALRIIGKLLGIVVHCMEYHGALQREWGHVKR